MSSIKLDSAWHDNELLCPKCNGNNLHHSDVVVFTRNEDAERVRVVHVEGEDVTHYGISNDFSANPSSRRGAVSIHFWCENCHGDPETTDTPIFKLNIIQHKGTTYLDWDY